MEPKLSAAIKSGLEDLQEAVFTYLSLQREINSKTDVVSKKLLQSTVVIPEEYLFYRNIKMFSGDGPIPLLVAGGFYDQPAMTMKVIEACIAGENDYRNYLVEEQMLQAKTST